jgi:hypothetical protein
VSSPTQAASTAPPASAAESAAPIENNPPGDIPDTQAFTDYRSQPGGYHLQVPEGWARSEHGSSVVFSDKLNSVSVDVSAASGPRTPDTVRSTDEPKLRSTVRAFQEVKVETVTLPAGQAMLLRYRANSAPSDVTGKVYRLEVDRYEVYRSGKLAAISLGAPAGSDNVDVWKKISRSFGWSS